MDEAPEGKPGPEMLPEAQRAARKAAIVNSAPNGFQRGTIIQSLFVEAESKQIDNSTYNEGWGAEVRL